MERELWIYLYQLTQAWDNRPWWRLQRYGDGQIVAVYFWAVLHDRPCSWACERRNWPTDLWPYATLPSQATLSRRLRGTEAQRLMTRVEEALRQRQERTWVLRVDGKPLVIGPHGKDRDARWGWASRSYAKGYEFHALYDEGPLPWRWEVTSLNVAEPDVATRLLPMLSGGGYVLGDKQYDSNPLHEIAWRAGYQLVTPRKRPQAGLGHRPHSPGRLRSIELLAHDFGQALYGCRTTIERHFGWLTSHAAGLAPLPSWVRGWHRVNRWVQAKLIIHAIYMRLRRSSPLLADA